MVWIILGFSSTLLVFFSFHTCRHIAIIETFHTSNLLCFYTTLLSLPLQSTILERHQAVSSYRFHTPVSVHQRSHYRNVSHTNSSTFLQLYFSSLYKSAVFLLAYQKFSTRRLPFKASHTWSNLLSRFPIYVTVLYASVSLASVNTSPRTPLALLLLLHAVNFNIFATVHSIFASTGSPTHPSRPVSYTCISSARSYSWF